MVQAKTQDLTKKTENTVGENRDGSIFCTGIVKNRTVPIFSPSQ